MRGQARRSWPRLAGETAPGELGAVIAGSIEEAASRRAERDRWSADGRAAGRLGSKTPALDQFTINLTERAKKGEIDPVIGRDREIRQVIDILTRRRQNNPILTGEAGVGKTAVVEGFALRIVAGDVPPPLQERVSCARSTSACLQAGAGVKGEFENRLKSVIARGEGVAAADHSVHRRGAHDDRRRRRRPARATPPTCSSRRWRAASCAPSRPPPGPSTRSTSRPTPP